MRGLTTVGAMLHEEHQRTLTILNALEMALTHRSANRPIDVGDASHRRNLQDFVAVVDQDVTRHFSFEEDHLFPHLSEAGAADMVEMLTFEHGLIRPLAAGLKAEVERALARGFETSGWPAFRTSAMELIERESFHIQKEEMGLIRVLHQVLDAEADRQLAALYAQHAA